MLELSEELRQAWIKAWVAYGLGDSEVAARRFVAWWKRLLAERQRAYRHWTPRVQENSRALLSEIERQLERSGGRGGPLVEPQRLNSAFWAGRHLMVMLTRQEKTMEGAVSIVKSVEAAPRPSAPARPKAAPAKPQAVPRPAAAKAAPAGVIAADPPAPEPVVVAPPPPPPPPPPEPVVEPEPPLQVSEPEPELEAEVAEVADEEEVTLDAAELELGDLELGDLEDGDLDLGDIDLEGLELDESELEGLDLEGVDLEGMDLEGVDLEGLELDEDLTLEE